MWYKTSTLVFWRPDMLARSTKIVLCAGARTPIGHISRSLSDLRANDLMKDAVEATLEKAALAKDKVDGLIVGWVAQGVDAPNLARIAALKAGLPEKTQAVTVQNNCISSIEAVASAARFIMAGEGELYLAGGAEVMSRMPYVISGSRAQKELRSLDTVKAKWGTLLESSSVAVLDAMERGLTDPVKNINMAGTAEVAAQMYGVTREAQDAYAHESFRRTLEAWKRGFYASHVRPVKRDGAVLLDKDEYPHLRADLVAKPQMLGKAPALFDNSVYSMKDFYRDYGHFIEGKTYEEGKCKGSVTLFNSCGRSDGASAIVVASEARAKALGLEILGELKGWGFYGNNPAHMGVSPALAAPVALKNAGIAFDELDQIELHEPFAATVLSIFKLGREKYGHDWEGKQKAGRLNPNGGSIALGHPLGATGTRLLLNVLHALRESQGRYGMIAACAGGGMGGAMIVERAA
ncbi:MAG: thiolase family protein [Elusimicrobia bacterium]|nr:thiolase family protein [Elusimicrobiota bacterium]